MSMTLSKPVGAAQAGRLPFTAVAIAASFLIFALMQAIGLFLNHGAFDYPLDDPYIHLALAETIMAGGYGVNPGDLASPGSSALYPLLLLPFSGTEFHRYLPLFWNIVALATAAWLWGRVLIEAGFDRANWRWLGYLAAGFGPVVLMMPMVAYIGMEHTFHAAATLAVLLGLLRHFDGRGGLALVVLGVFFGSAFRLEALALGFLAAGALFLSGERKVGVGVAAATIAPVAAFMGFLVSRGLDPLPSSVQTKLELGAVGGPSMLEERLAILVINVTTPAGGFIALMAVAILFIWRKFPALKSGPWAYLAAVTFLAAFAHLAVGQIGWLNRYEHYLLLLVAGTLLVLLAKATDDVAPSRFTILATLAVLAGGMVAYRLPVHFFDIPPSARSIHMQQGQMATFAKDYLDADVAVNDLGWVAWQNDNYVLDLWGLASAEARNMRLSDPAPGWTGTLTDKYDVPVAMVYDWWFKDGIGTDWVKVGDFQLLIPGGFVGGYSVAFYATKPEYVDMLAQAVAAWEPSLIEGSRFVWAEGMEP